MLQRAETTLLCNGCHQQTSTFSKLIEEMQMAVLIAAV